MSPISLGMDILLAVLLMAALVYGMRLNRQLKTLREGQAGFIRAVQELDGAAARAEQGLASLRKASEDTHDALLTRIETARGLIARLETANQAAAAHAASLAAKPAEPPRRAEPAPEAPVLRRAESRLDPRFRSSLSPSPLPAAQAAPVQRRAFVRGVDEDLFVSEPERDELGPLRRRLGER